MGQKYALDPDTGLRRDGRRPRELRRIRCQVGVLDTADGSAIFEMGNTQVLASVFGPHEPADAGPASASSGVADGPVRCDYAVAAFASPSGRRATKGAGGGPPDRRSQELARLVRAAVEQAVVTEALGPPGTRCRVDVSVQVLQADGGAAACAVNAALLALAHAGVPLRGLVAACAASRPPGCASPLLDPAHEETAAASGGPGGSGGDVVVAVLQPPGGAGVGGGGGGGAGGGVSVGGFGKVVMASAEGRMPLAEVEECVALSGEGCRAVAERMRQALLAHARGRLGVAMAAG